MIVDGSDRILALRRKGAEDRALQLTQGGIRLGESPLATIYREVKEETGLSRLQIEVRAASRDWLAYELPARCRNRKVGWGQVQRWFLCRLRAPASAVNPEQVEFSEAKWVTANSLICERVIGTIRRECLDWLIPISEAHLSAILKEWVAHYNGGRCHGALGPGVPDPPRGVVLVPKSETRHRIAAGSLVLAKSILGRLHHEYSLITARAGA